MMLFLGKRDGRTTALTFDMPTFRLHLTARDLDPQPRVRHGFGAAGWLMLGNRPDETVFEGFDGCGDCAWAAPAREVMESCKNAG